MRKVIIAFGILFIYACSKTSVPAKQPITIVQEEAIIFSTNLDTGTYNVADTLPLIISVSSKLPTEGVVYSIITTWTDSSKQIFKLDTSLVNSSLVLNITGNKNVGSYSLSIIVTSKSTTKNTASKSINYINNPLGRFMGYKVDQISLASSRQKDFGKSYWVNVGIPGDLLTAAFQSTIGFLPQISYGDFNNDGWIDIFNPGSKYQVTLSYSTFLIWNPTSKIFEKKNLFNNPSDSIFGGNKHHTKPVYLNNDNFVDFVVFDNGDEYLGANSPNEPIRLILSDGKGKYDVKEIATNENEIAQNANNKGGGDIGDLNGDGLPDLVITCGNVYIYWGVKDFPYFKQAGRSCFLGDVYNPVFGHQNDNGFGEKTYKCGNAGGAIIADVNKDGLNDILLNTAEDPNFLPFPSYNKFLLNQGGGKFNDNSVVYLPLFSNIRVAGEDYIVDDINSDNLNDIITLNHDLNQNNWNIGIYIQQSNGSFKIESNSIIYTKNSIIPRFGGGKMILFYQDINGDGKKDIGYYEGADNQGQFINKTIFIRTGNQFFEQDYYQYDPFAKTLLSKVN